MQSLLSDCSHKSSENCYHQLSRRQSSWSSGTILHASPADHIEDPCDKGQLDSSVGQKGSGSFADREHYV